MSASLLMRPRMASGFRLQWEEVQKNHVLLYPEGMVKLNQSAGEILKRVDGQRTVAEIVDELEATFNAQGLQGEVLAFIDIALQQKWVEEA